MTFSHPKSSYFELLSEEDSISKKGKFTTHQLKIRLILATEANKILLHLDFDALPGKGSSLFISFNKFDLEVPIEKSIRLKPPIEMSGTMIKNVTISLSTNTKANFNGQVFSSESVPFKY